MNSAESHRLKSIGVSLNLRAVLRCFRLRLFLNSEKSVARAGFGRMGPYILWPTPFRWNVDLCQSLNWRKWYPGAIRRIGCASSHRGAMEERSVHPCCGSMTSGSTGQGSRRCVRYVGLEFGSSQAWWQITTTGCRRGGIDENASDCKVN